MKKFFLTLLVLVILLFTGCSNDNQVDNNKAIKDSNQNEVTIRIVAPKSPATIPLFRMIDDTSMKEENLEFDLKIYRDMESMMALAYEGNYDFLIVPVHTAANLKNKGMDIKITCVFNWGATYLSTTDDSCNSWLDLKNKELYVPAKGSVPDIMTQYFLSKAELKAGEDVSIVYSNHGEISQLISTGKAKYAIDVQPFVTANLKRTKNYKVISEFAEEWKKIHGEEFSMPGFCMVINSKFIENNEKLINCFNEEFSKYVEWTATNPKEAGSVANNKLNANADLITEAMPGFNFIYKSSIDSKNDIEEYLKVLLDLKPEIIGEKLLKDDSYY